jgi:hypothetical protein
VVHLPTEPRARLPFAGAQGDDHEQDDDGHAANFMKNTDHQKPISRRNSTPKSFMGENESGGLAVSLAGRGD